MSDQQEITRDTKVRCTHEGCGAQYGIRQKIPVAREVFDWLMWTVDADNVEEAIAGAKCFQHQAGGMLPLNNVLADFGIEGLESEEVAPRRPTSRPQPPRQAQKPRAKGLAPKSVMPQACPAPQAPRTRDPDTVRPVGAPARKFSPTAPPPSAPRRSKEPRRVAPLPGPVVEHEASRPAPPAPKAPRPQPSRKGSGVTLGDVFSGEAIGTAVANRRAFTELEALCAAGKVPSEVLAEARMHMFADAPSILARAREWIAAAEAQRLKDEARARQAQAERERVSQIARDRAQRGHEKRWVAEFLREQATRPRPQRAGSRSVRESVKCERGVRTYCSDGPYKRGPTEIEVVRFKPYVPFPTVAELPGSEIPQGVSPDVVQAKAEPASQKPNIKIVYGEDRVSYVVAVTWADGTVNTFRHKRVVESDGFADGFLTIVREREQDGTVFSRDWERRYLSSDPMPIAYGSGELFDMLVSAEATRLESDANAKDAVIATDRNERGKITYRLSMLRLWAILFIEEVTPVEQRDEVEIMIETRAEA